MEEIVPAANKILQKGGRNKTLVVAGLIEYLFLFLPLSRRQSDGQQCPVDESDIDADTGLIEIG